VCIGLWGFNGIYQLLVYANDVDENMNTIREHTERVLDATKEDDLEIS
jgi:hypothetical protein